MKIKRWNKLFASALIFSALAATASAQGFAKTQEYTDGKFTDVASGKWYAEEVKSSYELGLMNGQSDTLFAPEGNVTVAEGITMASRVHSIYNGKSIAEKSGGKWYDMYIAYALENGLVADGQFSNYDRNIMRYEMAVMFAKAMPASYFTAKNDIKDIPDVAKSEEYYDELMMLYKAGVVMGSDDYGNFYATNPITRSETAAIINRVALPENRKSGKLLEYGEREPAYFLIDDYLFGVGARGSVTFGSGWLVEDRGSSSFNVQGSLNPNLSDSSDKSYVAAHRDVRVQNGGIVKGEIKYAVAGSGAKIVFSDSEYVPFVEIIHKDEKIVISGDKEYNTEFAHKSGLLKLYIELDIDNGKIFVSVNGTDLGTFSTKPIKNFGRLSVGTSKELSAGIEMKSAHLYTNYDVYDSFTYTDNGKKPYGWTATDNAVVAAVPAAWNHTGGVKIKDEGKISKKFAPVGEKFVYETYVLVPGGQKAYVALMNGAKEAIKVNVTAEGKLVCSDVTLREFDNRVWQCVRVEADTASNKAIIKINGKKCGTVDFMEDAVDEIVIAFEGKGEMLADNVQLYNVFDYTDYCPTPVPVNDDEWYVGLNVCSLWREGTHHGWSCIDGYSDIEPVLGCYDEGIPEVADWEIKFLSEHGYDFWQYCWYIGDQGKAPLKNTRMDSALVDGYFNAKYSDMLDFSIMWENSNCNFTDSKYFYDVVWPYWCEWFFSDERYMAIENKPVLTIYKYDNFITHMGGEDKAKEVISFMREDIKKLGYDDMIILFADRGDNAQKNQMFKALGGDAIIAYRFHDVDYSLEYEKQCMDKALSTGYLPFLPCVGVGFNDVGWTEVRTSMATADEHRSSISWVKSDYLPRLAKADGVQEWMTKFIFANTWNEYGEGHYIMPSGVCGFGYLDSMRSEASNVAGKNDSKHFDVVPTDNQKARLGYLHPATYTSMRKLGYEDSKQSVSNNRREFSYIFDSAEKCGIWRPSSKISELKYDEKENALLVNCTSTDDNIFNNRLENFVVDADKAKYLRIVLRHEEGKSFKGGALYFKNDGDVAFQSGKGFAFEVTGTYNENYSEVIVDLSGNAFWKGKISELRFDITSEPGKYYVKSLEFLEARSADAFVLNVDDYEFDIPKSHVKKTGDEVFVAGNPSKGFYTLQNMYHMWNRKTGVLYLKTSTDTEFVFTVGSNKALVNGKEKSLSSAITLYDGLVQIPLYFVYENSSIPYTKTENGVKIKLRDISYLETINREENKWEFNLDGDNENWAIGNAQGGVANGTIYLTASEHAPGKYDPRLQNTSVNIDTKYHRFVNVRMRAAFDGDHDKKEVSVYFATVQDKTLNEAKSVKFDLAQLEPDDSGFYTVSLDMQTNEKWTGIVSILRVDPTNYSGFYEFDYIRVEPDETQKALLQSMQAKLEAEEKAILAADNGEAFYIANSDAEDTSGEYTATSSNATVTIVTDPDNASNKAYLVKPTVANTRSWTYFYVPTRFKPGVKYRVEYDIKIVGDLDGNPVQNASITPNFRYTDYTAEGTLKVKMDHTVNPGISKLSNSDGWVHFTIEHTISVNSPDRASDFFAIYSNPQGTNDAPVNVAFMVDNIVVTSLGMAELGREETPKQEEPKQEQPEKVVVGGTLAINEKYSWEFDSDDATLNWNALYADTTISNGKLCLTATLANNGRYDPQISKNSLSFSAAANPTVKARLKAVLAEGTTDKTVTVYFTTDSDKNFNSAKTVKISLDTLTPDTEGFYELNFDMSSNENWKGTVTKLRLDPTNSKGYFEIDYVRVMTNA